MTKLSVTPGQAAALVHYAQYSEILAPLLAVESDRRAYDAAVAHLTSHFSTLEPLLELSPAQVERAMAEGWREDDAEAV
jgi:hypothetical protein